MMEEKKDIIIIGVSVSHNATAAILKNGEILGAISEERLVRKKNVLGYPKRAVEYLMKEYDVHPEDIDRVVLNFHRAIHFGYTHATVPIDRLYTAINWITFRSRLLSWIYDLLYRAILRPRITGSWYEAECRMIADHIGIPREKIIHFPHFLTHAASVAYAFPFDPEEKILVLTSDGAGDEHCGSVNILHHGTLTTLHTIRNRNSLAGLYGIVTRYLGMRENEDEYKVMGLAPYANTTNPMIGECIGVFRRLIRVESWDVISNISERLYLEYVKRYLAWKRFDCIAAAIQRFIEESLTAWVKHCIQKTDIHTVACAGGIFMNVKANKCIAELPDVRQLTIMPSAGDESTSLGAAYLGYRAVCEERGATPECKPLSDIYLGNTVSDDALVRYISEKKLETLYTIERCNDIEERVAQLLSEGHIVARFSGKMEFGARALGNRSILANPSSPVVIQELNDRIKSRDFWMPFAGSILAEHADRYLINTKHVDAPFMMMTFDTTPAAQKDIPAAMHPYDHTIRPQLVTAEANPSYHRLLTYFYERTGIAGVLNTSFNLHGEPIVCSLSDAFHTFADSGLRYMAIGPYLFMKKIESRK